MRNVEKYKSSITDNYYEDIHKIVSIFFYQTIYNIRKKKLLPLNSNNALLDNSKYSFKRCTEKYNNYQELYGPYFENFEAFCNGDLDMKGFSIKKELESEKIIKKMVNNFYSSVKLEERFGNKNKIENKRITNENAANGEKVTASANSNNDSNINKEFIYESILEHRNDRFDEDVNNEETASFLKEAYGLNKQKENKAKIVTRPLIFNTNSINQNEANNSQNPQMHASSSYQSNYYYNNDQINNKKQNQPSSQSKPNYFHQLGEESYEVDFLIKMCEKSDKQEEPLEPETRRHRKYSFDNNNATNTGQIDMTQIYDNNLNENQDKEKLSSKKDLAQFLNNLSNTQKSESDTSNLKTSTSAIKTPEIDKSDKFSNPFKIDLSSSAQNQKNVLNSIKKSPISNSPFKDTPTVISFLGNKRKNPDQKTLDFSSMGNKSPNLLQEHQQQTLAPTMFSPNPNLNYKTFNNSSSVRIDLSNAFKSMKKD